MGIFLIDYFHTYRGKLHIFHSAFDAFDLFFGLACIFSIVAALRFGRWDDALAAPQPKAEPEAQLRLDAKPAKAPAEAAAPAAKRAGGKPGRRTTNSLPRPSPGRVLSRCAMPPRALSSAPKNSGNVDARRMACTG